MLDMSTPYNRPEDVQVTEVLEKKGMVPIQQGSAVKVCSVLSGGLGSWRSSTLHVNQSVSKGAKWISPPYQALRELELEQDTHLGFVRLEESAFDAALSDASRHRVSLIAQENIHDPALDELVTLLLRESRNGYLNGPLFAQSLQTALASYLLAKFPAEVPPTPHKGGLSRRNLRRCLDYIEEHFADQVSLDDLARETGVSRSHLIRSFRISTGASPHQYLLRRRVEHAKSFMGIQHYTLTDVALACGFANQHHLSRVFRSLVGGTPTEYRSNKC
ncbi:MAG: helix-turn-helix domain-containing protein [Janthinobacterium lividum]